MDARPPLRLDRYRSRAAELTRSPDQLARLLDAASAKADGAKRKSGRFAAVRAELSAMIDLLRAWTRGDYREVSTSALVTVAAAVLYFFTPLDMVPDFILGLGLFDDAAIIAYVVSALREEIAAFQRWRADQGDEREASD